MRFFPKYLIGVLTLLACESEELVTPTDYGYDFYPLKTGRYAIYAVEETNYSQLSEPGTSVYQLKTEVIDSFKSSAGDIIYVIFNSTRMNESDPWAYKETLSARMTDSELVIMEGSTSYVKLDFPLTPDIEWNGNKLNNLDEDEYRIVSYDQYATINGLEFEKTLTVEQEAYDDEVTRTDERSETYARGVGLISRDIRQLTYCTQEVCLNDQIIESGVILKQRIITYGE